MDAQSQIQFRKFDFSKILDLEDIDLLRHVESYIKGLVSQQPESFQWILQPYVALIEEMIIAYENQEHIIYQNGAVLPEIMYGMDLLPFSPEALSFLSPIEYLVAYKDRSFTSYVPEGMCTFHSAMLGMALSNLLRKPAGILFSSVPCDSSVVTCQALSEYFGGVSMFAIDSPYDDSKEAHEYYASQIKGAFQYAEEMSGKKLNIDNLREVVRRSDKTHELLYQINELKKKKPCPVLTSGVIRAVSIAMWFLAGSESMVHWLEKFLADVKQRAEKGIGGIFEEKMRIAWVHTSPNFDPAIYKWMEERFGAISVIFQGAEHTYWPTYKPRRKDDYDYNFHELCEILADKNLNTPMVRQARGHIDYLIRDAVHWCRDWHIDAVIFAGHIQCRAYWSSAQVLKEVLMDELGVPTLIYELDMFDPRVTSAKQTVRIFEPFLEMVAENKGL